MYFLRNVYDTDKLNITMETVILTFSLVCLCLPTLLPSILFTLSSQLKQH